MEEIWNARRPPTGARILLDELAVQTARRFDIFFGGIDGTPKFPNVPQLELIWRAYLRTGVSPALPGRGRDARADVRGRHLRPSRRRLSPLFHRRPLAGAAFREDALRQCAAHLDPDAGLAVHAHAHRFSCAFSKPSDGFCARCGSKTRGFASSLDADTDGKEGAFYVWSEAEIDAALAGTFTSRFKLAYGVRPEGNFEGGTILHRTSPAGSLSAADEQLLAKQRAMLFTEREKRRRPNRDDKVLANWNGLTITALTFAASVFGNAGWLNAARAAFSFVTEKLGEGDRLYHSYRDGKRQHMGFADDYTNMAQAALALWEATGERAYLLQAEAWAATLERHFWDPQRGGYRVAADDAVATGPVIRTAGDLEVPAANATAIGVLARLAFATGNGDYAARANAIVEAFTGDLPNGYLNMATFLCNFEFLHASMQIVIVGAPGDARTRDLVDAVRGQSLPNRLLTMVRPGRVAASGPSGERQADAERPADGLYLHEQRLLGAPDQSRGTVAIAVVAAASGKRASAAELIPSCHVSVFVLSHERHGSLKRRRRDARGVGRIGRRLLAAFHATERGVHNAEIRPVRGNGVRRTRSRFCAGPRGPTAQADL